MRLIPISDGTGRLPLTEIMLSTGYIRKLIVDAKRTLEIPTAIKEGAAHYGMQTFDQALHKYYSQGKVSYKDAIAYASNPDDFALEQDGVISSSDSGVTEPQSIYSEEEDASGEIDLK